MAIGLPSFSASPESAADCKSGCSAERCGLAEGRGRKESFNLCIQLTSHLERFGVVVRSKVAGHPVIGEMNSVGALVDQNGDRCIRSSVWYVLGHLAHDERITYNKTQNSRAMTSILQAQNSAKVEARELHEAGETDGVPNDCFQFGPGSCAAHVVCELGNVRMTEYGLQGL